MRKASVAVIVPEIKETGGLATVGKFFYDILRRSEKYEPELISIPMSSNDPFSKKLISPKSWCSKTIVHKDEWFNKPYTHVGAILTEFEFQRYMSRRPLTKILNNYDLVQVVAGTPAWGMVTRCVVKPVFLQVATLAKWEREGILSNLKGIALYHKRIMTYITSYIEKRAIVNSKKVFVENIRMYKWARRYKTAESVIFAPPGINDDIFRPGKKKYGPYILSVGRFGDPRKNIELLFRAYWHLKKICNEVPPLVIAGRSMPPARKIEEAKRLGIMDNIIFKKNIPIEKLAELYRNATFFVMSSDEEGLGMVILEAMASGLPVIATRCGGPEMVIVEGENGYLVEKNDFKGLAEKMAILINNSNKLKMFGKNGRRLVQKYYSLEAAGKRYLDAYDIEIKSDIKQKKPYCYLN